MTYKMSAFPMLIVLLCVLVSEATNFEDEWVCPTLSYWNEKVPNTSIPNALREVICPHNIADHLFVKNIQDVKAGDVSIYSHKYIGPRRGDVSIYSHKYNTPQVADASIYSHKYIAPRVGDVSIYSRKYIAPQVGDVSIYSHKYIAPQVGDVTLYNEAIDRNPLHRGGDVTLYNHKYAIDRDSSTQGGDNKYYEATDRNPLHRGGDVTLYNHKYAIARDSSTQGGDTILERDPNQGNVEYHRKLLLADPLLSIFFFEKDLHIGTNLMVHPEILKAQYSTYFLPRTIANEIPFSLEKLLVALDVLNIPQDSDMSIAMEEALKKCESPAITGETRYCATSMESMIDYSTARIGSNHLSVLITDLPNTFNSQSQQYSVSAMVAKSNSSSNHVICHNLIYPYAIYMCHEAKGTKIFELSLQGQGTYGTSIPLVAICHADTSGWNPEHAAFMALNVKPGEEAICHFMLEGTIVWLHAN